MNTKLNTVTLAICAMAAITLSGCSTILNTAGSGDYGCPGMPAGVLCKTPAAVYKSTHLDVPDTEFDIPIGPGGVNLASTPVSAQAPSPSATRMVSAAPGSAADLGPRPVREPSKVVRIWIAPWVDRQDNLHLAQIEYTEVQARTWTVGKPESAATSGYVIPHLAYSAIPALATGRATGAAVKNEHSEKLPTLEAPPAN
jgi:conjugal transfer pilus assembly protein TraV